MILTFERFTKKEVKEDGKKNLFRRMPINEEEKLITECRIAEGLLIRLKPGHKRPEAESDNGQDGQL